MVESWEKTKCKCHECDKVFIGSDAILTDPEPYPTIVEPDTFFIYINKNGIPTGGDIPPNKEIGDKVLSCPHCKKLHLFGFTSA